jgi:hypothetical protein
MIDEGPICAVHGVAGWRLIDLAQWIFEEFRIRVAKQTQLDQRALERGHMTRYDAKMLSIVALCGVTIGRARLPSSSHRGGSKRNRRAIELKPPSLTKYVAENPAHEAARAMARADLSRHP